MSKARRPSVRTRENVRERPRAESGRDFPVSLMQIMLLPLDVGGREMLTGLCEPARGGQRPVLRASVVVTIPHE